MHQHTIHSLKRGTIRLLLSKRDGQEIDKELDEVYGGNDEETKELVEYLTRKGLLHTETIDRKTLAKALQNALFYPFVIRLDHTKHNYYFYTKDDDHIKLNQQELLAKLHSIYGE